MAFRRHPETCPACRDLRDRWQEWRERAARGDLGARAAHRPEHFLGPHGELGHAASRPSPYAAGRFDLYHCRRCDSWWELGMLSCFRACCLRPVRVTSVSRWQRTGSPGSAAGPLWLVPLGALFSGAGLLACALVYWLLVAHPVTRLLTAAALAALALVAVVGLAVALDRQVKAWPGDSP